MTISFLRRLTVLDRSIVLALGALLVAVVLWLPIGFVLTPKVVVDAYNGESVAALNRLITGQSRHSLAYYLGLWSAVNGRILAGMGSLLAVSAPFVFVTAPARCFLARIDVRLGSVSSGWLTGLTVSTAVAVVLVCLFAATPRYLLFVTEDGLAEWGSFVFAATAASLFASTWPGGRSQGRRTAGVALLAVASFVLAWEEISWGQRLLGFATPGFLAQENLQRELSLHNLTDLGIYDHALTGLVLLSWVFLPLWLDGRPFPGRTVLRRIGIPSVPAPAAPVFVVSGLMLLVTPFPMLYRIDEVGELLLAVSLAAMACCLVSEAIERGDSRGRLTNAVLAGTFLWCGALTVALTLAHGPRPTGYLFSDAINQLPRRGMQQQALQVVRYARAHEAYRTPQMLIEGGILLMKTGDVQQGREYLEEALVWLPARGSDDDVSGEEERQRMIALRGLGRTEEADIALRLSLQADSARLARPSVFSNAAARLSLARTLWAAGRREEAWEMVGEACLHDAPRAVKRRTRKWAMLQFGAAPSVCKVD